MPPPFRHQSAIFPRHLLAPLLDVTGDTRWSGKQKTKTDPRASGPVLNVPASILLLIFRAFGPVNSNPVLSGSDIQSHNFRSCILHPRHLFTQIPILYFPAMRHLVPQFPILHFPPPTFVPTNSNPVFSGYATFGPTIFRSCILHPRHLFIQIPILYFPAPTLIWCRTVSAPACPVRNISTVIAPRPTTELRGGSETRKLRCEQGIKQVRAKAATPGGTVPVVVRRLSVCLSVCHKSEFSQNGWMDRAGFWRGEIK